MIIELTVRRPLSFIVSCPNDDTVFIRTSNPFIAARVARREATLCQRDAYLRISIGKRQYLTPPRAILPKLIGAALLAAAGLLRDCVLDLLQDLRHRHD